jgi:GNAT superfamily N-acetyltransferase
MHRVRPPQHPNMKNLGEVLIRPAEPNDACGILRCLTAAFEPYSEKYTPEAFADTVLDEASLVRRMQRMHLLVAASGRVIVGTIAGSVASNEGHLRGMAVLPEWHRTGLAAMLLRKIEDWLKDKGCARVTLDTTLPLAAAIRFYEKNGYRRSGQVTDFFGMPLVEYVKELA